MKSYNKTQEINYIIGWNIRRRRKLLGISAEALAEKIGLSPQQIYRYENADDRISASVLMEIAQALSTDIKYLVESSIPYSKKAELTHLPNSAANDKKMLKTIQYFNQMPTERLQECLTELMVSIIKALKEPKVIH